MKKIDRMRERVSILPTSTYLSKMHDAGWTLIALEWEREVDRFSDCRRTVFNPRCAVSPPGIRH